MYEQKIILKNKRNIKERLELTLEEFKDKFKKELDTALNSYKRNEEYKNSMLPIPMQKNTNYETDFYFDLRFNFNHNSNSAWYIERIFQVNNRKVSGKNKKIVVEFKEKYMDISVTRECIVPDLETVIELYGLNNGDIEYWKLLEEKEIDQKPTTDQEYKIYEKDECPIYNTVGCQECELFNKNICLIEKP